MIHDIHGSSYMLGKWFKIARANKHTHAHTWRHTHYENDDKYIAFNKYTNWFCLQSGKVHFQPIFPNVLLWQNRINFYIYQNCFLLHINNVYITSSFILVFQVGDFHSSLNAKSWLYVFDYQTKNSFYIYKKKILTCCWTIYHFVLRNCIYFKCVHCCAWLACT